MTKGDMSTIKSKNCRGKENAYSPLYTCHDCGRELKTGERANSREKKNGGEVSLTRLVRKTREGVQI